MRHIARHLIASIALFFIAVAQQGATANDSAEHVRQKLEELHTWLGTGSNGQAWRRYLKSDELSKQLTDPDRVDREVVSGILQIYSGDARGLDRRRFVAVRDALQSWMVELESQLGVEQLPQAARDAIAAYRSITPAEVAEAKQQLLAEVANLDRLLARSSEADSRGWKEFLKWPDMQGQLSVEGAPDLRVLQPVLSQYYRNENGIEMPQFVAVREALRAYMNMVLFSTDANVKETYESQLNELAQHLASYAESYSSEDGISIGRALGFLHRGRQAGGLVKGVQRHYWQPNLYAHVSRNLIASGIERDVDERLPVRDNILGTSLRGTARTTGKISLAFVSHEDRAEFEIRLTGVAESDNVGRNRGVTIYSTGSTRIAATKRVRIDEHGLHPQPARAHCVTDSSINGIAASSGLIRRIAWRRAASTQPEAERIASRRAERRVADRVDEQAAEMLAKGQDAFRDKIRNPLVRRDAFPRLVQLRTSEDQLRVRMMVVNSFQLAAPQPPPELDGTHDVALRVHESLIGNSAESILGGIKLTDEKLANAIEELTGSVPEELQITPDKDPWSITFAPSQPISVVFGDQSFKITIRGRSFTRGDQDVREAIEISASYTMERTPDGAKLTRQGDVQVDYVGREQLSATQVAFRTFLRRKFEALLEAEVESEGVKLPGRWENLGKLKLQQLAAGAGWLTLGWKQVTEDVRTAAKTD